EMAGEVGIEPTNAGIKIRCLTTWRLPSGENRRARHSRARFRSDQARVSAAAKLASGCRTSVRATKPRHPDFAPSAAASAAVAMASEANTANTLLPEPVIRADGDRFASKAIAAAMSG